ncbi:MAG TPA: TIGR03936 family radical SAM-associated protein [Patescibacteria group bacterium]|nr:TIGR03936 family radical SAM-associated protein [Patescibacteria group bacterium]
MRKLRLQITKGEEIRHISHLDYSRALERALRRAKLPVAYSEGFNPHMKFALASALALGVTSDAEYVDVEMTQELPLSTVMERLQSQTPPGLRVLSGRYMEPGSPAPMAIVNRSSYMLTVPLAVAQDLAALEAALAQYNQAPQVPFCKVSPKGRRDVDLKQYTQNRLQVVPAVPEDGALLRRISLDILITPTGSIKPAEVLAVLVERFGLPTMAERVGIHRTGLYVVRGTEILSPIE